MARESTFSGDDAPSTGSAPTSHSGDASLRSPALGRSSRDLATDTGPAGAPEATFGTGADADEMRTGSTRSPDPDPDADAAQPRKGRHPEIDPDTRLGLHPTIKGDAAPDTPTNPDLYT